MWLPAILELHFVLLLHLVDLTLLLVHYLGQLELAVDVMPRAARLLFLVHNIGWLKYGLGHDGVGQDFLLPSALIVSNYT